MMVGSYSNVKSRSSYIRYQEEQVIIRICHECEAGTENLFRGSPFGITRLAE